MLRDGSVAVLDDIIADVGPFPEIKSRFPDALVQEHPDSVLMPPLVNGHVHLELSYLSELGRQERPGSFTEWIVNLLETRARKHAKSDEIISSGREALNSLYEQGVFAVLDTGNLAVNRQIGAGFQGIYMFIREFFGLAPQEVEQQTKLVLAEKKEHICSGHAPYSTAGRLLSTLKKRTTSNKQIFSIHVAETFEEVECVRYGRGLIHDFLEKRGAWHDSFVPTGTDDTGSVAYLDQLGIIDNKTICVHGVHVDLEEIRTLAKKGAKVCLCPGSNRYLGTGLAPVEKYLQASILPALGTDSLASNPVLSIWNEMRILKEDHPEVASSSILAMATLGGAAALEIEDELGTLTKGKSAKILSVPVPGEIRDSEEVLEYLVRGGLEIRPYWV